MPPPVTIECKPNGPYLVKSLEHLQNAQGNKAETQPVMALCRCGGSANKPFCDGTHQNNGFTSDQVVDGSADKLEHYAAKGITIHDNRSICAHAGACTDGLESVFKYKSEPWIDPAGGAVAAIVETIRKCPSGALSYTLDGVIDNDAQQPPSITATKDGPYTIAGDVELAGQTWAEGAVKQRYTLCRCGASKNKPFCDGTHWSIAFKDPA